MKRTPKSHPDSPPESAPILAFGAHPDDIEFGCGGVIALESQAGHSAHFVVCSLGESGSNGMPKQRKQEALESAAILGATVEFIELDGDAHLEIRAPHIIKLAKIIRQIRPIIVFAPSIVENQHPDHSRLGRMVRDAMRLARYGGVRELKDQSPHTVGQMYFYAITPDAEPTDITPILVDISDAEVFVTWTGAMSAHESQAATRNYIELQHARARTWGFRADVPYAIPIYPNDPLVFGNIL